MSLNSDSQVKSYVQDKSFSDNPCQSTSCSQRIITAYIENVQCRVTKLIPPFRELSNEECLRKLDRPTLAYRLSRGDMREVIKVSKE